MANHFQAASGEPDGTSYENYYNEGQLEAQTVREWSELGSFRFGFGIEVSGFRGDDQDIRVSGVRANYGTNRENDEGDACGD